jgi:hypothetical protein
MRVKSRESRVKSQRIFCAAIVFAIASAGLLHAQGTCYIDPFTGQKICTPAAGGFADSRLLALDSGLLALDSSPHCRITVGDGTAGSGTLVARTESGGLVLTCSHLFDGSTANTEVAFSNGQRYAARLVERDRMHDLAALVIRRPDVEPAAVSDESSPPRDDGASLSACGFGPNAQFRCVSGNVTGLVTAIGAVHPSMTIRGAVRPGDSGGGVFRGDGRLVGVVWGQRDGITYAMCGRPLRELLDRVLGRAPRAEGRLIRDERPLAAPGSQPAGERSPPNDWKSWANEIEARIRALDAAKQEKGDYLRPGDVPDLSPYAKRDELDGRLQGMSTRFESIVGKVQAVQERIEHVAELGGGVFQGLSTGKLLVGALGLSGPLAAAVLVGSGLLAVRSRRSAAAGRKRDATQAENVRATPIAVDSPPPPQRAVPETHYVSYEVDAFAKAHQWASEQVVRKYPGAAEIMQAQDSLIKQHLASR